MIRRRGLVLCVVLAVIAVALLAPLPRSWRSGWRSELLDFGHVPLFGFTTIAIRLAVRKSVSWCVVAAVLLAGLAEALQHGLGRSASIIDWLYGALGAGAGAAMVQALKHWSSWRRFAWLTLALGLLTWPATRSGPVLLDAFEAWQEFPTLAHFETERARLRWETRQALLQRDAEHALPHRGAARLTLLPGPEPYPSAVLTLIRRDLSGFRWLCCECVVERESLELVMSVRGGPDASGHTAHGQIAQVIAPGEQHVCIDLPALATRGQPRALDLSDIWFVQLFVVRPASPRTLYLRRIWLEP